MRTLATPEPIKDWSLKIGAKVVSHGRYVAFQMAEVAIPRNLFGRLLAAVAPQGSTSFYAERKAFVNHCPLRLRISYRAPIAGQPASTAAAGGPQAILRAGRAADGRAGWDLTCACYWLKTTARRRKASS
jgi:hypothetical protein